MKHTQILTWFDRGKCILLLVMLIAFIALTYLSIARYRGYNAAMNDLGNMSQAIWSATQGQPLVVTTDHGPLSRLALHVELIYFLFVPIYALFPSPVTLLLIQVFLFVAAAFPLYNVSLRYFENVWAALSVALVYLFYPVAQAAVLFDFHGDTLAMPLLVFALAALERKAWRQYTFWLILALSCKFYVAIAVIAFGGMLWLRGERRAGIFTSIGGLAWGGIAYFWIRPVFSPPVDVGLQQLSGLGYFLFYFGQLLDSLRVSWAARVITGLIVFLPVSWPLFKAPWWWLPALSVGLPALLSSGPGPSYYYGYHHYALVVPFAVVGAVHGIAILRLRHVAIHVQGKRFAVWPLALGTMLILTMTFNSFFLDTPLKPDFWNRNTGALANPLRYARTSRDKMKDVWLEVTVPDGVPLAASNFIATHLTHRSTNYVTDYFLDYVDEVDYVVADALFDFIQVLGPENVEGGVTHDWETITWLLQRPDFGLIAARDGLLLFMRDPEPSQVLAMDSTFAWLNMPPETLAVFAERIALLDYDVTSMLDRRLSFEFCWLSLSSLSDKNYFAVSRLEGVADTRFVHLPTLSLQPTSTWRQNQRVCETFETVLPLNIPPGEYPLWVGWYDSKHPFAFMTDARSRMGQEIELGVIQIP